MRKNSACAFYKKLKMIDFRFLYFYDSPKFKQNDRCCKNKQAKKHKHSKKPKMLLKVEILEKSQKNSVES